MSKKYYLKFGSGDPASYTGLSPTFSIFAINGVSGIVAPGITESPVGSGLYGFIYGPTQSIIFKADGGVALSTGDRYIVGALDPIQAVDESIGTRSDSFGSTSADPTTVYGYMRRSQEFQEGNALFTKATGVWDIYSRGSSTLLVSKTLSNDTTAAEKE